MEITLGEIASKIGGKVVGNANHLIKGVSQIQEAKSGTITFFSNPLYRKYLDSTDADAIIVEKEAYLKQKSGIVVKNSQFAMAKTLKLFNPILPASEIALLSKLLILFSNSDKTSSVLCSNICWWTCWTSLETSFFFVIIVSSILLIVSSSAIKSLIPTLKPVFTKNLVTISSKLSKNVLVLYGNQTIKANLVKIDFTKNSIEILENVHYTNENLEMFADIVEIDLLKNKLKISMNDQKNKVLISGEN